jgi:uncharacterized membrane protein YheB (UPF0754 family)
METLVMILLPLFAALLGWLAVRLALHMLFRPIEPVTFLGFRIQGLIPGRQQRMAEGLGSQAAGLLELSDMSSKAKDPALIASLMPGIEQHIDGFLQQRLKEKIPVLAMFLSDGVLLTIRTSLLEEIEALLPEVVGQFADKLGSERHIGRLVTDKLSAIPPAQLERRIRAALHREIALLSLGGAGLGFLIGIIQLGLSAWLQAR